MLNNYSHLISFFTITLILLLASVNYSQTQLYEGGYANKFSVAQGDSITFYISSSSVDSTINIFQIRDKAYYKTYYKRPLVVQYASAHSDSTFWYGCGWDSTLTLHIDESWNPGVYRAEFGTYGVNPGTGSARNDSASGILFFIKDRNPGNTSKNLLLIATNTWQAYNDYGGKSLYDNISTDSARSYKVSFNRPANRPLGSLGSADFYKYEYKFINWASLNNIPLEYASMYDLDRNSKFLFANNDSTQNLYKILLIVGHNEYWSIQERQQCEQFIDNGGKVIILSGNTCWWQVRFEDNGQTMVCYKDSALDRNANPDKLLVPDSLITTNWWKSPVNNPENSFTGVNFKDGGYVNSGTKLPKSSGFGDYAALNTQFWVYDGICLKEGDEFGFDDAIVGYETDGTPFHWDSLGLPVVDGADGTPPNFKVLGVSPTIPYDNKPYGHATMGIYYKGDKGAVFNGATTDWADGLLTDITNNNYPDPVVDRITINVLNKFLEDRFPPDITSWGPSTVNLKRPNYDPVYLNVRDTMLAGNDSLHLFISAQNPFPALQDSVKYFWKDFAGNVVSTDSNYEFTIPSTFASVNKITVTGYAYNNEDTASISWNIFTSPLVILNSDSTGMKLNTSFTYKIEVFSYYKDTLNYQLIDAPAGLSIDSTGMISGNSGNSDTTFIFSIIANDKHGNADTLNFKLVVSNNITGIENQDNLPNKFYLS
ncbi:MAG TPA: Ig domain-containing protein, partial [Ignavibacteriaceae bacterium]|nr:Ig domain-containing protein [Ignavibacteriaceae bacterium]